MALYERYYEDINDPNSMRQYMVERPGVAGEMGPNPPSMAVSRGADPYRRIGESMPVPRTPEMTDVRRAEIGAYRGATVPAPRPTGPTSTYDPTLARNLTPLESMAVSQPHTLPPGTVAAIKERLGNEQAIKLRAQTETQEQTRLRGLSPEAAQEEQMRQRDITQFGKKDAAQIAKTRLTTGNQMAIAKMNNEARQTITSMTLANKTQLTKDYQTWKTSENLLDRQNALDRIMKQGDIQLSLDTATGKVMNTPEQLQTYGQKLGLLAEQAELQNDVDAARAFRAAQYKMQETYYDKVTTGEAKWNEPITAAPTVKPATEIPAAPTGRVTGDLNNDGVIDERDAQIADANKALLSNKDPRTRQDLTQQQIDWLKQRMGTLRAIKPIVKPNV